MMPTTHPPPRKQNLMEKPHAGIQEPKFWTQDGWTSVVMDSYKIMVRPDTTFFITTLYLNV